MKVVAIEGSPHRGNTARKIDDLGRALEELGDVDFECIALREHSIAECRGCFRCFIEGAAACPIDDEVRHIERKMLSADAVVLASPVYAMHVSSLMKKLIDRLAYTFHRPAYHGHYAVVLAVTGGVGLKETLSYLKDVCDVWGFHTVGSIGYVEPPMGTSIPRLTDGADRTKEIARSLHSAVKEKRPKRLSMNDYLTFMAMRALYARSESFLPTDHEYWRTRGWLEPGRTYFVDNVLGNPLLQLWPRFLAWLMRRRLDQVLAGRDSCDSSVP